MLLNPSQVINTARIASSTIRVKSRPPKNEAICFKNPAAESTCPSNTHVLFVKYWNSTQTTQQITLAISLHAPNDEIRQKTMPIAKKYSIEEIFSVCREYVDYTGRRVTFEYSMIDGVNDGKAHALELARRCKGLNCHINLIPLNEVKERKCHRSKEENIRDFKLVLEENRINVTIRREMGSDIDAACGQLRNQFMNRPTSE